MGNLKNDIFKLKKEYNSKLHEKIIKETKFSFQKVINELLLQDKNLVLISIVTALDFSDERYQRPCIVFKYGLMDKDKASKYPNRIINLAPANYREPSTTIEIRNMLEGEEKILQECTFVIKETEKIIYDDLTRKNYIPRLDVFPEEISLFGSHDCKENMSFITGTKDLDYEAIAFKIFVKLKKEQLIESKGILEGTKGEMRLLGELINDLINEGIELLPKEDQKELMYILNKKH